MGLTNAFNLVGIVVFLEGVRKHFSSLSSWIEHCFGCQTQLFIGESVFLSCCGVKTRRSVGGPLLFAIAL